MSDTIRFFETFKKMPMMQLPVRTTLVPVKGGLVLISPGTKMTDQELKALGPVTDIVAPNLFHLDGIPRASRAFPKAKIWGIPGAELKKPVVKWANILSEKTWPYQDELPLVNIEGMPMVNETLFVHNSSKSLIATDFFFNMVSEKGFWAWLILSLFGTYNKLGISRFFLKFVENKTATRDSVRKLMRLDFDRLIPSHGQIVETEGKLKLEKVLTQKRLFSRDQ